MGMEVANSGMYDGASALAEAALMACRVTGRERIAYLPTVSPAYLSVMRTYTEPQGLAMEPLAPGEPLPEGAACIVAQSPDFFGYVDDLERLADEAHEGGRAAGGLGGSGVAGHCSSRRASKARTLRLRRGSRWALA